MGGDGVGVMYVGSDISPYFLIQRLQKALFFQLVD